MARACHIMVAKTAEAMAEELYESLAHNDAWYKRFPDRTRWVNLAWPQLIGEARRVLHGMLSSPIVGEEQKAEIYDALVLDGPLQKKKALRAPRPR